MQIACNRLDNLYNAHSKEYEEAAIRALRSGYYVLGSEVKAFEKEYADYMGTTHCVGLNSGLDALILAINALGIGEGDEVIVPANTYIASVLAITHNRATPVFVEPDNFYNIDVSRIQSVITKKTKAILCVHLYGQACNMTELTDISNKYHLYLIEDCAQSHNAKWDGKLTGTFGDIGCFSFFPTKNFGAFGDAGAVITNNEEVANKITALRNYGSLKKYYNDIIGFNSRLDEIQAALLRTRLNYLNDIIAERKQIAAKYLSDIKNPCVILPDTSERAEATWHLFVVRCNKRDELQKYLLSNEIQTQIHYPVPPHLAKCYSNLGYTNGDFPITENYSNTMLSLPLYNGMTPDEMDYVISTVNRFK